VVQDVKNRTSDNDGFQEIHDNKDQINSKAKASNSKDGKGGQDSEIIGYVYKQKNQGAKKVEGGAKASHEAKDSAEGTKQGKKGNNTMAKLLMGLKAENSKEYNKFLGHNSDDDDDDDVNDAVERRMSMN